MNIWPSFFFVAHAINCSTLDEKIFNLCKTSRTINLL